MADADCTGFRFPVLSTLLPLGDGTWLLRPVLPSEDPEQWISMKQAAQIMGLSRTALYPCLDRFLVWRKPDGKATQVQLGSVLALQRATGNPKFWDSPGLQKRLSDSIQAKMNQLVSEPLQ